MAAAAAATVTNWLGAAPNPFDLRIPPDWFLRELATFDADLVLFPSQQSFHYRLARRCRKSPGITKALSWCSDAAICVEHHLIPVTSLGGTYAWGRELFQWLADRDTWRVGGGDKAADLLDAQDQDREASITKDLDAENTARAKSMFRTYQTRVGAHVSLDLGSPRAAFSPTPRPRTTQTRVVKRSAPVPPTGWNRNPSGLVTPPTS